MIRKFLEAYAAQSHSDRRGELRRALIRREAKIGGELFGAIPAGHRREFFCLDPFTWIWHEEWMHEGQRQVLTTRYEIRPGGVIKSQNGQAYRNLSLAEGRRFKSAVKLYSQRVQSEIYAAA